MNPLIKALPDPQKLEVIQSQVALVLPDRGTSEQRAEIANDAAAMTALIAYYDYDLPLGLVLPDIAPDKVDAFVQLFTDARCLIDRNAYPSLVYRWRAASFFLRTWQPHA